MVQSSRIFGLDILRAVAITSVLIMHSGGFLNSTFMEGFPFFDFPDGVDLFFALSGFLIGTILLKEINKEERFGLKQLWNFWKRRWFRTLPNYYLVLVLNIVVVRFKIIPEHIEQFSWKFLVFLQNFNEPFEGFFWESWTLSVEEWFYVFAPVLLLLTLRILKPKAAFIVVALIMILFPLIQRIKVYDPACTELFWSSELRRLVIYRLDSIAYGLVAAWVYYYYPDLWRKLRYPCLAVSFALIYLVFHYHPGFSSVYVQVIQLSLNPVAAMCLLPLAESIKTGRGFIAKAITHVSKISYSLYLINLALVAEVIGSNLPIEKTWQRFLCYLLFWVAAVFFSSLLYKYYEKPMMDLRDRK